MGTQLENPANKEYGKKFDRSVSLLSWAFNEERLIGGFFGSHRKDGRGLRRLSFTARISAE
jgi:hypothetical protein